MPVFRNFSDFLNFCRIFPLLKSNPDFSPLPMHFRLLKKIRVGNSSRQYSFQSRNQSWNNFPLPPLHFELTHQEKNDVSRNLLIVNFCQINMFASEEI